MVCLLKIINVGFSTSKQADKTRLACILCLLRVQQLIAEIFHFMTKTYSIFLIRNVIPLEASLVNCCSEIVRLKVTNIQFHL